MNVVTRIYILVITAVFPTLVFAQQTFGSLVDWFVGAVNQLVLIIMAAALLLFLWGVVVYIFKLGDTTGEHKKGPQFMFWGIMILFVMTSLWGLVNFIGSSIF